MFLNPDAWIGFLPENVPGGLSRDDALQFTAVFDTLIGIGLILCLWQKTIALLAALHLAAILLQHGIDQVLIRDVGLLGAALALFMWPTHYRKHRLTKIFRRRKKKKKKFDEDEE